MFLALLLSGLLMTFLEILVFIELGDSIGWLRTILLAIATSFLGASFAKIQLKRFWDSVQRSAFRGTPQDLIGQAFLLYLSGILLWTPGFITDLFGVALLFPAGRTFALWGLRRFGASWFSQARSFNTMTWFAQHQAPFSFSQHDFDFEDIVDVSSAEPEKNSDFEPFAPVHSNPDKKNDDSSDDILDVDFTIRSK